MAWPLREAAGLGLLGISAHGGAGVVLSGAELEGGEFEALRRHFPHLWPEAEAG